MANWIPEKDAAKMVKREPRTLRKLVNSGKWLIETRTLNGRSYHYKESDINKLFNQPEKMVNTKLTGTAR